MIKKIFLQNENIFKKDFYFVCNKHFLHNTSQMRYIFLHFHLYFSLQKKFFSVKNIFNIIFFYPYKNIFSANNVYFAKKHFFKENKICFQLSFAKNEQPYLLSILNS